MLTKPWCNLLHSQERSDQAQCQLVKQNWLVAYQKIIQWAQPSWNVLRSKRSLLGFLPSRNLNTSAYWRNRVGDHMSNYEQPYVYSPTGFSHCFHYNRKLCQGCSLRAQFHEQQPNRANIFILLKRETLLSSPSPSKSVELLSLIILPGFSQAAESI